MCDRLLFAWSRVVRAVVTAHLGHPLHVVARSAVATSPAVQREAISATLALLVVVAPAIALLGMV
jgi:hypothetical protein